MRTSHLTNTDYDRELQQSAATMEPILAAATARLEKVAKGVERSEFDASYKLKDRRFPYSCTLEEGLALHYVIRHNGCKSGYEMATAFGFSSLFMGAALQANGGRLVTVDCYVEAAKEDCYYTAEDIRTHVASLKEHMPHGNHPASFVFARSLGEAAGLADTIDYRIGVSPDNVAELLEGRQIDVAFVDGGHFGMQPVQDLQALLPFLAPKCAVFFHDNFDNEYIDYSIATAARALRSQPIVLDTFYKLTLVGRNLDPACVKLLHSVEVRRPFRLKNFLKRLRFALRRKTGYYC